MKGSGIQKFLIFPSSTSSPSPNVNSAVVAEQQRNHNELVAPHHCVGGGVSPPIIFKRSICLGK
jgi:hypothetical protein